MTRGVRSALRPSARLALRVALAAALLACSGDLPEPAGLLLVSVDTLRADHTSLYGYARDTTPELRRLGERSAVFDAAYAASSTTAPSHASLFTSLYPIGHGVLRNGEPLAPELRTLAEMLHDEGYQTAAFVSSFVLHGKFGWRQGFDVYDDRFEAETATRSREIWNVDAAAVGVDALDRKATATTSRALAWLRESRDPARPFFVFVHYFDPHSPYAPDPPWDARFAPGEGELAAEVAHYDGEIACTDDQIGALLRGLDALGLAGDTLVVVTADHGEGLMDHGVMEHGVDLYEEAVRVPLLFHWPGRIAPRRFAAPLSSVSVVPTVLDLLGAHVARAGLDGASVAAALREGGPLPGEQPVFLERRRIEKVGDMFAVRRGEWKYIEAPHRRQLFHLRADPTEHTNMELVAPPIAEQLAGELAAWRERQRPAVSRPAPSADPADRDRLRALGYVE